MAAAYSTSAASGVSTPAATTYDSPSVTVNSGDVVYVIVAASAGSPSNPTSCKWDPTGVNESLTQVGSTLTHWSYARASLFRGVGLTAKSGVFRATWPQAQDERIIGVWVGSGIDATTPNGTVATATGTNTTPTATATTTAGQLVLMLAAASKDNTAARTFNSPTGTERFDAATSPDDYDNVAAQDLTASGSSTSPQWTLSGTVNGWSAFVIPINDAAASGTTVNCGVGALALAGQAPSVSRTDSQNIATGTGALAIAGVAPSIAAEGGVSVATNTGALAIAGVAPAVSATGHQSVASGTGALALAGQAPSISAGAAVTVNTGTGSLVLAGNVPDLTLRKAAPRTGQLVLTGVAPSVQASGAISVNAGTGALSLAGQAPTISADGSVGVAAGTGALAVAGVAPTVSRTDSQTILPSTGSVVITAAAPGVSQVGSFDITTGTGSLRIAGYAPNVIGMRRTGAGRSTGKRRRVVIRERVYSVLERDIPALIEAELLDRAPPVTAEVVEGPKPPQKRRKSAPQPVKTAEQVREAVAEIRSRIEPDNTWLMQALETVARRVIERLEDEDEALMLLLAA